MKFSHSKIKNKKREKSLFFWLSDELKERKTYSTFMKLMDNYFMEEMTEEIEEQWTFLDVIYAKSIFDCESFSELFFNVKFR